MNLYQIGQYMAAQFLRLAEVDFSLKFPEPCAQIFLAQKECYLNKTYTQNSGNLGLSRRYH